MLKRGQKIDRYEVTGLLGRGGMAVVYGLKHQRLGSSHALKVLELSSPVIRERFEREGQIQARLNHPNVVSVTDTIEVEGHPAIVMEFIAGPPLDVYLDLYRPSISESLAIFRQICVGVGHAHAEGVVHRDLKPGNVMLAVSDLGVVAKVTDFGLAKVLGGEGGGRGTKTGAAMGTPAYMAPEQFEDAKAVDHRADIYSLGAILYEILCARPPYVAEGLMEMVQKRIEEAYPPPEELCPGLSDAVSGLIRAMLEDDPSERPPSIRAVLAWLDGVSLDDGPLPPAPPIRGRLADSVATLTRSDPSDDELDPYQEAPEPASDVYVAPSEDVEPERPRSALRWLIPLGALALLLGVVGAVGVAGLAWVATGAAAPPDEPTAVEPLGVDEEPPEPEDELAPEPASVATPAPAPSPAAGPAPPAPKPSPVPVVEPTSAPVPAPAADTGRVVFTGDADLVYLRSGGRDFRQTDALAPGTYEVHAVFDGASPIVAGRVTVAAGEAATVHCTAGFQICTPK